MTEMYSNEDDLGLSPELIAKMEQKQLEEKQMLESLLPPSQYGEVSEINKVNQVKTPRGMSLATFKRILNAVEVAYKTNPHKNELPTVDFIKAHTSASRQSIMKVLTSAEGKDALLKRGIAWTNNKNVINDLSPEQALAISIITDPSSKKPLADKLKQAGISMGTWRNWLANPAFKAKVINVAEALIDDNIATAHARLVQRMDAGDTQAIRLFYEVSGRHDPTKQQTLDIARIIGLVLEVLTRHVTDVSILEKVSYDIEIIMSGGTPKTLTDLPNNYVKSGVLSQAVGELPELPEDYFSGDKE